MKMKFFAAAVLTLFFTALNVAGMTDSERVTARQFAEKAGKALVRVEGTIFIDASQGGERKQDEEELKTCVTVITEDGYALGAAFQFNPAPYLEGMSDVTIKTNLTKLQYVFDDGTTLDAEVVLEDKRTGWALLRPVDAAGRKFDYVNLNKRAQGQVFDEVFSIHKMDEKMKFTTAVSLGIVGAKIDRPQRLYELNGIASELAHPVFNTKCEVIGFFALKVTSAGDTSAPLMDAAEAVELLKQTRDGENSGVNGDQPKTRRQLLEEQRAAGEKSDDAASAPSIEVKPIGE